MWYKDALRAAGLGFRYEYGVAKYDKSDRSL